MKTKTITQFVIAFIILCVCMILSSCTTIATQAFVETKPHVFYLESKVTHGNKYWYLQKDYINTIDQDSLRNLIEFRSKEMDETIEYYRHVKLVKKRTL